MASQGDPAAAPVGPYAFDLFVVHAEADAEFVHGYLLPALGLPPSRVLVFDALTPGAFIASEIDRGVTRSGFTVAVLSPAYLADRWAVFGEQLANAIGAGDARIIPLRLIDCQVPLRLEARVALDFTDRARWDAGAARLRQLLGTAPPPPGDIECPYPGMHPFTASQASRFFGRDRELGDLIGRLDRGEREIYVIGPSGSGKSSLVHAGLLHALDAGASRLGRSFAVRSMRPGERPTDRLANALEGDVAAPGATIDALLVRHPPAERVLVFVDQLEELFTLAEAAERQRFTAALRRLRAEPRCYLLLALRADFYGALMDSALWPELAGQISRVDVAPLRGPALAEAITKPALQAGVYLEARLCDRLVADAADEPGALPLVQETLRLLWDRRRRRLIGVAEYEALGDGGPGAPARRGLDVAIAQHAGAAMRKLTKDEQRAIARRVLLRLVSFGVGRADTRRQQPVEALRAAAKDPPELSFVLQHLVDHRLITVDDAERPDHAVADLSHEALITAWPELATWIAERRVDEQRRRRLEARVADWIEHGRGVASLLDGVELAEAERWLEGEAAHELGYGADLLALVAASRREVEKAERQRRARLLRALAALAAFSVVVSALGLVVWRQREEARRRARQESTRLGMGYLDQSLALLSDGHPLRALPYLVAARAREIEDPMLGMLFAHAVNHTPRVTLRGHRSQVRAVAFSPDGTRAITASDDDTARIWDTATGKPVSELVHRGFVLAAVFSRDGTRVATASADTTARVWSASTGRPVTPALAHHSSVYTVEFSPDGTRVVTASPDDTARVWNASTGELVSTLVHESIVRTAAFSPDGTRVVTASADRTARVWDATTGDAVTPPLRHGNVVLAAAFSPDGKHVVTASSDRTGQVWDATTGEEVGLPLRHSGPVRAAAFRPDGTQVITASDDTTAQRWDVRTGAPSGSPLRHQDGVSGVVFSADGKQVLTLSGDGAARVWDAATDQVVAVIEHARDINAAAFSPDGTRVITASKDDTARIWDASPERSVPRIELSGELGGSAFSPDGTRVVTAGPGNTARVWNALTGVPVTPPVSHDDFVYSAAFSPDGARVITAGKDRTARVWDARTGLPVIPPLRHPEEVSDAGFSPDGTRVITVGYDRTVRLWDVATGRQVATPLRHDDLVNAAVFSRDGTRIVTASGDAARIWDAATGAPIPPPLTHRGVAFAAFSPDGRCVITAGRDETARVWDAGTGSLLTRSLGHQGTINAAAFSPDGKYVITASADRTAQLWEATTGRLVIPPLKHTGQVWVAAFSPDGRRVITGGRDESARIWDASTGRAVSPPLEHSSIIKAAAFSPDGRRVAISGRGHTRIWTVVLDEEPLDRWRLLVRCSPFALEDGVLVANHAPLVVCPRP